jgi:hypothetical protein
MNRKAAFFVVSIVVVVIGIIVAVATRNPSPTKNNNSNNNQGNTANLPSGVAHNPPTDSDFTAAIATQSTNATFTTTDFKVSSSSNPATGWFIIKVAPDVQTDPLTVLIRQNKDNTLTLVAGPSTQIAQSTLTPYNVPQTVLSKLPVIDDAQ